MGAVLMLASEFAVIECCWKECRLSFAMPSGFKKERLLDHGEFFCPRGHRQFFLGETEETKLKRQLEAKQADVDRERRWREMAERSLVAQRALATRARNETKRLKERVANGVCPFPGCKRAFKAEMALTRHLKTKHPEFAHHHEPGDLHAIATQEGEANG